MLRDYKLERYPDMLTVEDVSEILRVGKKSIYMLMNNSQLRYKKIGRKYITSKKWLREYFEDDAEKGKYGDDGN